MGTNSSTCNNSRENEKLPAVLPDTGLFSSLINTLAKARLYNGFHPEDYQVADLSKDRSKRLQQTECEANLLLMAYKNS